MINTFFLMYNRDLHQHFYRQIQAADIERNSYGYSTNNTFIVTNFYNETSGKMMSPKKVTYSKESNNSFDKKIKMRNTNKPEDMKAKLKRAHVRMDPIQKIMLLKKPADHAQQRNSFSSNQMIKSSKKPSNVKTDIIENLYMNSTHINGILMEPVNANYTRNIYFTIKTTHKYYKRRLFSLLLTWLQVVDKNKVSYVQLCFHIRSM